MQYVLLNASRTHLNQDDESDIGVLLHYLSVEGGEGKIISDALCLYLRM